MDHFYGWKYILGELDRAFPRSVICILRKRFPEENIVTAALVGLKTPPQVRQFYNEYVLYLEICNRGAPYAANRATFHIVRQLLTVTGEIPELWQRALKKPLQQIRS